MSVSLAASAITFGTRPSCLAPRLDTLPVELQDLVLDELTDEDDLGRMGATSRHWRALVLARPLRGGTDSQSAFERGDRHGLARALNAPPDASFFATDARDGDQMTYLMHAARSGDRAMLRCLVRHGATQIQQADLYDLTARDWATLHGRMYVFDEDVSRAAGHDIGAGLVQRGSFDLHRAITLGHGQLVATLLGSHFRADNPFQNPFRCQGFTVDMTLSCGLSVATCARQHAPRQRPVLDIVLALCADEAD